MTEKSLDVDLSIVPQEKFWDCGPASAQIVLNSRGINMSEDELINRIGTDENGTAYVGLVENVLDVLLPQANYTSVGMPDDPPSPEQAQALWDNTVRSIDAGYPVVANIVAPPSNYPIGVKGSPNPNYRGGTIFHYLTIIGYDPDMRAFKLADPGFAPFEYWVSAAQMATLIPDKAYCYADTAPAAADPADEPAAPPPPARPDPATVLYNAVPVISLNTARMLLPLIAAALALSNCRTVQAIAIWLANIGHESGGFVYTEEIEKGDGGATERWKYLGRTWIQITWLSNYLGFSQWCFDRGLVPTPTYFGDNPAELADQKWAALGPAWYWTVERPQIPGMADAGDLLGVSIAINGENDDGLPNGWTDRQNRYNQAIALGDQLLALLPDTPDDQPETGGFLMTLNDDEQHELLAKTREIWDQLRGPGGTGWPQLGQDANGNNLSLVDAVAGMIKRAAAKVSRPKKTAGSA